MNIKLKLDPTEKMLLKRSLNKNGLAHKFFTSEVRRIADPYVPFDSGNLKNNVYVGVDFLKYLSPYARRQYRENKGNGLRGKLWDVRMWADRGREIVKSVANFVGGKAK